MSVGDVQEPDEGFVWVEVARVRVYSCYFYPNDPFEVSENQILLLDESLIEAVVRTLIGGDFNSKSPEWCESHLDRRILGGEMVNRNDPTILNQGREFTFRRGAGGLIIDLTIAAPHLASRISDWSFLEVITLSDHRCIEFDSEQRCQAVDKARVSEGRSPSCNTRQLCRERLRVHLQTTRLIDEPDLEDTVRSMRQKVVAACDYSMSRRKRSQAKGSMYWWNDQLAALRRECLAARRRFTRSKGDSLLHETSKRAKAALR